jgi:peptidoglycan/xylan/chitin deacetylase (PgdA/CDA1 family)
MRLEGVGGKKLLVRICSNLFLHRLMMDKSSIRIVVYHRIMENFDPYNFPYDHELVDATSDEFERELTYLKRNFNIVTFGDVIRMLDDGVPLPERALLITLDDGYQDNYLHAFPLLCDHKVPATMLLAASYIGGESTFWYDRLVFILKNIDQDRISFGAGKQAFMLTSDPVRRMKVFKLIMRNLASIDNAERLEILEEINRKYGYIYDRQSEKVRSLSRPLTWQQVAEMSRKGVEMGSHTMTHPFLSRVDRRHLFDELSQSKTLIEQHTGSPVRVVAYPNGQRQDFNDEVKQAVREAGYSIGLSYVDGVNPLSGLDRFALKRLHMSPRHDFSMFRMALSWPGIF